MTSLLEPFGSLLESPRRFRLTGEEAVQAFVPAADLVVSEDEVTVMMDVPGFKREDLEIELDNDHLSVRGERKYPYSEDNGNKERTWHRFERGYGKFERILRLPGGLDADSVSASLEDGVLTLHVRKPDSQKPHRIEIAAGESTAAIESGEGKADAEKKKAATKA